MRYRNIIWDFDGTLFDTYPGMCENLRRAMGSIGIEVSVEELMPRILTTLQDAIEFCAERGGVDPDMAFQTYRSWVLSHPFPEAVPFPGAKNVVETFRKAGGQNFIFTHRGKSVCGYLEQEGWTPYFTEVVPFSAAFERKPSPSGNLYLIERHGLAKEETLAVGDRELDVLAAKNAGITACLISREPVETAAEHRISGFEELYALIGLEKE